MPIDTLAVLLASQCSAHAQTAEVTSPLPPINVTSASPAADGSAAAGYRVQNTTTTGPWGDLSLQDTPYSINVIPSALIENLQATQPDQILRMNPVVQLQQPTSFNGRATFNIRGFTQTSFDEDGMLDSNGWGIAMEEYERVEVLSGLSGFLYGPANVGGLINFVSKRPTETPFAKVTAGDIGLGDSGAGSYYIHGDFGGPIDKDGRFAYRLNLVSQDGDYSTQFSQQRRNLASGVLDWHVFNGLTIEALATVYDYHEQGNPPSFSTASGVKFPDAPNPDKVWSEPWAFQTVETDKVGTNVTWDFNKNLTFRGAYRFATFTDQNLELTNVIQSNGTYTQSAAARAFRRLDNYDGYAFLDGRFETGPFAHKVTFGYYENSSVFREHGDEQASAAVSGTFSLTSPVSAAQPNISVGTQPSFADQETYSQNLVLGDIVTLNRYFSLMGGVNYSAIGLSTFKPAGVLSSHYGKTAPTPTASLLFKPVPWLTTYVTYIQSLEQGTIVPNSGTIVYTNAGQILKPVVDQQYEVGAKATLGGVLLTAALFDINKANQFALNNGNGTYTDVQDGREIHKGVEVTATGRVLPDLIVVGGVTLFNAQVTSQANNPSLDGKRPMNVAEQMAKVYLEYDLPFVSGLTLTGGAYYTGSFYADAANTDLLPAVLIGDIGARYTTHIDKYPLTIRFDVANVANTAYWQSAGFLGDPRRISLSAETQF
jgi:iron complex outermembrane recepter protein